MINVLLTGEREEGNLKTRSKFWIELLKTPLGISIDKECQSFWEIFNIRRNASSHRKAKATWESMMVDIKYADILVWLYGLIYLTYIIDGGLTTTYNIQTIQKGCDFSGKPVYNFNQIKCYTK